MTFLLKTFSVIALFQFCFYPLEPHPLHVSTTDINYNAKDKSLEVICRIFTDDFEAVLASNSNQKIDLLNSRSKKEMDVLVAKYLKSHLSYRINNRIAEANYVGYEVDKEAVNVYLEIPGVGSVQTLAITNSILFDRFDDQMNIVHVEKSGVRKSAKVNFPQRQLFISF